MCVLQKKRRGRSKLVKMAAQARLITPGLTVFTDRPIRSLSLHGRMQMMHDKARCVTTLDMDAFETRSIKEAGIH